MASMGKMCEVSGACAYEYTCLTLWSKVYGYNIWFGSIGHSDQRSHAWMMVTTCGIASGMDHP
jgi:hypothetical protein